MNFKELLKSVLEKGFCSEEKKAEFSAKYFLLNQESQEEVKKDMSTLLNLPTKSAEQEVENTLSEIVDKKTSEIAKEVEGRVQKLLDEHKKQAKNQIGAYSETSRKNKSRKMANEYLTNTLKSIVFKGTDLGNTSFARAKELFTTTPSEGGYTVGETLDAEIRRLVNKFGVSAQEFNTVTFKGSVYKATTLITNVLTFWVDEGDTIKSTGVALGQEELRIKKLAAIAAITKELLLETEIDFVSFIGTLVAESFAQKEDLAFFVGDGTPAFGGHTGILNVAGTSAVVSASDQFSGITVEEIRGMQDVLPSSALNGAKYYCHRSIVSLWRGLKDGSGAYLVDQTKGTKLTIDGYEVVPVEAMPKASDDAPSTKFVVFGNLKLAVIRGIRGGIEIAESNSAVVRNVADNADVNMFTSDRTAIRWTNQVGAIVILPAGVATLATKA